MEHTWVIGKMAIPPASQVHERLQDRAKQAKADLAWLAAYQASTKSTQKLWERLAGNNPSQNSEQSIKCQQFMTKVAPQPNHIMEDPQRNLPFAKPIQDRFTRVFQQYRSIEPSHNFGHYLNLAPILLTVAILEEFLENAYEIRTGGASLKKSNGQSRSLNTYIDILDFRKPRTPKDLVPHQNHALVVDLMNVSGDVRHLAKLRHKASHAYRGATYNADWANVVQRHIENAIKFVDDVTAKLLSNAVVARPQTWFRWVLHRVRCLVQCIIQRLK
ncbi:MAG: hypothetical protein NTX40_02160 [Planctomycetota bacterium]|nr:hypothetical protein [Planctomycetota bacterium]